MNRIKKFHAEGTALS